MGGDVQPYLAGFTPAKDGSMMRSTAKKRRGGSPTKTFQDTGMSQEARQMRQQHDSQPAAVLDFNREPASTMEQQQQ